MSWAQHQRDPICSSDGLPMLRVLNGGRRNVGEVRTVINADDTWTNVERPAAPQPVVAGRGRLAAR